MINACDHQDTVIVGNSRYFLDECCPSEWKLLKSNVSKIITRLWHHIVLFRFSRTQDEDWEDDEDELW